MGIGPMKIEFLRACAANGVDFSRTVTLGRQVVYPGGEYADALFTSLGAEVIDSIDLSGYEGATIVHDLNTPLCDADTYTAVVDIGTSEHVYDIAACMENITRLCEVGGHVIFAAPANNFLGHGLYQFSPDFFFRRFGREAGFEMRVMLLGQSNGRWSRLADPADVGERVGPPTRKPAELYVCARRRDHRPFSTAVQADEGQALAGTGRTARIPAVLRPLGAWVGNRRAVRRTSQRVHDVGRW